MNVLMVIAMSFGVGGVIALLLLFCCGIFLRDVQKNVNHEFELANKKIKALEEEELKKQRDAEFVMEILDESKKKEKHRSIYDPIERPW